MGTMGTREKGDETRERHNYVVADAGRRNPSVLLGLSHLQGRVAEADADMGRQTSVRECPQKCSRHARGSDSSGSLFQVKDDHFVNLRLLLIAVRGSNLVVVIRSRW